MYNEFMNISKVNMPSGIPKINFNRRTGNYEISCSLFSSCNLNCNFCFQDHTKCDLDTNKIMALPELIIDTITNDMIDYYIDKKIYLRLYGGELFSDNIPDSIFDVYKEFYIKLKSLLNEKFPKCTVEGYWGSNGVFNNHIRVSKLLNTTSSYIAISYDGIGRFHNIYQKNMWLDTLKYFHKNGLSSVSIMLIKPSIIEYINGDDFFNSIPSDVIIDVNQYIPNPSYEKYIMNDDDLYNFYKWCIDNDKYNVDPINSLITNYLNKDPQRHCYCKCSNFFDVNGYHSKDCVRKYSKLNPEYFYGKYSNQINDDNCTEVKNFLGLQKRGCLYCEYYSYCPTICWTSIIFENYKTTICPYQRLYRYIEENNTVVNRFKEWRRRYERCQI